MQQGARNMVLPTPVVSEEGNVANSSSASNRLHLQHTRPHTQTCGCVRHSRTEDYICHPHLLQEFIMKLLIGRPLFFASYYFGRSIWVIEHNWFMFLVAINLQFEFQ